MKRLFALILTFCLMQSSIMKAEVTDLTTLDNVMYVANTTVVQGTTATLSICMKNTAEIRGFQFDLYLPEGVTVTVSNKGKVQGVELNADRLPEDDEHSLTSSIQDDGAIRFLCGSQYQETFTGNDGELLSVQVNIDANMADGEYPIILKNILLSENDVTKSYETEYVETTLTVGGGNYVVATPTFTLQNNDLSISCATAGTTIYYTTDGSTPTKSSTKYAGPITLTQNCTVKAIAVADGYENSEVATYVVDWFKVATPTFDRSGNVVTISTTTTDATIYYTTDGSTPTKSSTLYTGPFTVTQNCTVKAIAVADGYENSEVATYAVDWFGPIDFSTLDNVIYVAPATVESGAEATLSIRMKNTAAIRGFQFNMYLPEGVTVVKNNKGHVMTSLNSERLEDDDEHTLTTSEQSDGAILFLCGSQYQETFLDNEGEVLYVIVKLAEDLANGEYPIVLKNMVLSENDVTKSYEIESVETTLTVGGDNYVVASPTFTLQNNMLSISCATAGTTIYYTTDGTPPTKGSAKYTAPITLTQNCTVKAIAVTNSYEYSIVAAYVVDWFGSTDISTLDNVIYAAPATAEPGTKATLSICMKNTAEIRGFQFDLYLPEGVSVSVSDKGKVLGVELNANRLPEDDEHTLSCSIQQDGAIRIMSGSQYQETFTGNDGELLSVQVNIDANMADGVYPIILKDQKLSENDITKSYETEYVETTLTVEKGNVVATPTFTLQNNMLSISCATAGTTIYYTTDGNTPTKSSTKYTGPITLTQNCTVKAIAVADGYEDSEVATYVVDWFKVATPTFDRSGNVVTISTTTTDATIYYTTDGSTPTKSSTLYTGPFTVTQNCTVKAIAVADGYEDSEVATYEVDWFGPIDFSTLDNVIYVAPATVESGAEATLSIRMKNTAAIRGFQFNMYLPEGVTVVKNNKGHVIASLNSERLEDDDEHTLTTSEQSDGAILFLCGSQYQETFLGNEGEVLYVIVKLAEDLADGEYPIVLKNIILSENDVTKSYEIESVETTLTVGGDNYVVATPTFTLQNNMLSISCATAGTTIYYTTDGTPPTKGSAKYTAPITLTQNCTVKAIAVTNSYEYSIVAAYVVDWFKPGDYRTLDNVIYVAPATVETGTEATLSICMKNTAEIRGFQFDMYLPEGVTVTMNNNGKIQGLKLSENRLPEDDEHTLTTSIQTDGAIRFLCGSQYNETFTGNDGEVITLQVNIGETMLEGEYPIILKNILLSENDVTKSYETEYVETTLTVGQFVSATMDANGYTTYASPYALDLPIDNRPSGLSAYKATVNGTTVLFTELDQTVPANTGVLLKGTAGKLYRIHVASEGEAVTNNAFEVNTAGTVFDAESGYSYFTLIKDSDPLLFYKFNPSTMAIPAKKAYLKVPTSARQLITSFGNEEIVTGIADNNREERIANSRYYNLNGQRVEHPTKGLYIQNGKKIVIK